MLAAAVRTAGSSSTSRIISDPPRRAGSFTTRSVRAFSSTNGRYTRKVVPRPGSVYTVTAPPLCVTIP